MGATSLLAVSAPRLGGLGRQNFFCQTFANEGSSISLPAALKTLHCNLLVWGRMARQGGYAGRTSDALTGGSVLGEVLAEGAGDVLFSVLDSLFD